MSVASRPPRSDRHSGRPDSQPVDRDALTASSLALILELQDGSGAYPASPTFSAYRGYSWFRDGAFIADGVSAAAPLVPERRDAAIDSATRFFDWCSGILIARRAQIAQIAQAARDGHPVPDEQMLATRFTFDGAEGSDDWWDFQLDGYGTWLWAFEQHAARHSLAVEAHQAEAVRLSVRYLVSSWQRPCFDWWEEHAEQVHVSTLGCVVAGLEAALRMPVLDDPDREAARAAADGARALILERGLTGPAADPHLAKWLGSDAVDGSLSALVAPLDVFPADSALGAATIRAVDAELSVEGGVHRFRADVFFGGGRWPLLSAYLALAELAAGDRAAASRRLDWILSTADEAGQLPEQVGGQLLAPEHEQEWIDRWGSVARPLLWSHAMLLRLVAALEAAPADTSITAETRMSADTPTTSEETPR